MALAARLHATLALATYALFPPPVTAAPPALTAAGGAMGIHIIPAGEIAATIASLGRFTASDGSLSLLFEDAMGVAAPFLLFRLKRDGYSVCRVTLDERGLLLTARR